MLSHASKVVVLTAGVTAAALLPVFAQERDRTLSQLYHRAWTSRDGAPGDVQALAQTTDGFLWLGTQSGLFRFDGVRFELFDPPAPDSLPALGVRSLHALRDGGIWVGFHFGGVSLIRGGSVRSYGQGDGLPRGSVLTLAEDAGGVIWAGTTGGLAWLGGGRWHRVGPDEGFDGDQGMSILIDRGRRLWVSSGNGVYMRAQGASRFDRVGPALKSTVGYRELINLEEGLDGAIWASSTETGLWQVAPPSAVRRGGASYPGLTTGGAIMVDRSGALWISHGGNRGIERFGTEGRASETMIQGLSGAVVTDWLEDREGNVWAGTPGGVDQFRRTKLTRVELPGSDANFAIAPADSGAVWVGSDGRHLMRVGQAIKEFPEAPRVVDVAYRDPEGVVWVGSPKGLWRYTHGRFLPVGLPGVGNLGLQALTRDGSGNLWISIVGVGVYQRLGERWVPFGGRDALPREPAVVLTTDESGRTWFGYTGNRVAVVEGDSVRLYTAEDGLSVGIVLAIHVRGSHVWVGGDRGLAVLAGGRAHPVIGRIGTRFRGISGIVETGGGELWLHGAAGITRIPADDARRAAEDSAYQVTFERLDFRDGLTGTAAQIRPQPTLVAGTDGRLWFATSLGVTWLDPSAVPRNPEPPPVAIRRLAADARSYQPGPDLRLPVRTTNLRIDYTAPSLSIPDRVRFRYQLVGSDTGWQDAGGRREAFYTNLGPGSYRFHVIAANEDGAWNEDGAAVDFTIPPRSLRAAGSSSCGSRRSAR